MAANGRGNMRPAGRSPPFLAIGLFVALVILGFNYWSLSARNGEQSNEIVLLESELRLVNAKKTSAEKRSEAISDKVTELEKQLNEQKEVIAKNQAEIANVEKEKLTFIERTNELEGEVRTIRDQQLPSCEIDKKNLQQEVEQLRADVEVHKNKNKECTKSDCEIFMGRERDATLEDVYKTVGASPLISMHKSNVNLGSYKDQIAKLAAQMDQEAFKKQVGNQQQPQDTQQQQQQQPLDLQQQQPIDAQQQQQQPIGAQQQQQQQIDAQQQQQQPIDAQQQQPIDTQQQQPIGGQQQPLDTQQQQLIDTQQQQQQPIDSQQQQPIDTQQQQQQQQPIDTQQQQQQPVDTQQQPLDTQQNQVDVQQPLVDTQQQADTGMQYGNMETGQQVGPAPDLNKANDGEVKLEASNVNEDNDGRAVDTDRQEEASLTTKAAEGPTQEAQRNTTMTTETTSQKPGINSDKPLHALNVAVPGNITSPNTATNPGNGDAKTPVDANDDDGEGALDHYKDDDDEDADDLNDADTLRVGQNQQTGGVRKNDDGIDEMFQRDRDVAAAPLH